MILRNFKAVRRQWRLFAALRLRLGRRGERIGTFPRHFFCRHDAYGKGDPAYVIERRCGAHPDLAVGDASPWVVLNASAWEASADPGLRDVLRYLRTGC